MTSSVATAGAAFFSGAGSDAEAISASAQIAAVASLQGALPSADGSPPLLRNFVDGQWVVAAGGRVEVVDPSTGLVSCYVGDSNAADVELAVQVRLSPSLSLSLSGSASNIHTNTYTNHKRYHYTHSHTFLCRQHTRRKSPGQPPPSVIALTY